MSNKKYYWLKLKEDFFEEDTLQWLEEQEHGTEYCLFYLKLCLKSLKTNGLLIRTVGQMLIPYDAKKLSEITRTNIDTVKVAMELFKGIGLVQILENGGIFLTELQNMVGSETNKAQIMRNKREKDKKLKEGNKEGNNVTSMLPEVTEQLPKCYTEIEKEKEKELYIKDIEEIWSLYPRKKGKATAIKKIPKILKTISKEELIRCIERYTKEMKGKEEYIQYGSTFFNGGYEDYLDKNYNEPTTDKKEFNYEEFIEC